jgi:hypothetical protein
MAVAHEETFGPVAALFRFESDDDAIRMANDTEFGLAAFVYTRDLSRSWRRRKSWQITKTLSLESQAWARRRSGDSGDVASSRNPKHWQVGARSSCPRRCS